MQRVCYEEAEVVLASLVGGGERLPLGLSDGGAAAEPPQNVHALHLQKEQCVPLKSAEQKEAQSMKLLSSACDE